MRSRQQLEGMMGGEQDLTRFSHGLVVLDAKGQAVHHCLYERPPTRHDMHGLLMELHVDGKFGLANAVGLRVVEMTADEVRQLKHCLQNQET